MIRCKRHSFSLIEVMIALSIFSLVAAVLFGLVRHNVYFIEKLQTTKMEAEKLRLAQVRLQKVLNATILSKKKFFYTTPPQSKKQKGAVLLFFYKHEVDRQQELSADVPAKLFLDNKGNLTLVSWPSPKKFPPQQNIPMRKEIILENIASCTMEFWAAPIEKSNKPAKLAFGEWLPNWEKEYNYLPTIIRFTFTLQSDQNKKLICCFLIPKNIQSIHYGT